MKTIIKFSILILCVLNVKLSFPQENPEIAKINTDKLKYEQLLKSIKAKGDFSIPGVIVIFKYVIGDHMSDNQEDKSTIIKSEKEIQNLIPEGTEYSSYNYILKDENGIIRFISTEESSEAVSREYIYFNNMGNTIYYYSETNMDWYDSKRIYYFDTSGKQIKSQNICHENDESGKSKVVKCEPIISPKSVTETLQTKKLKLVL
jgi:hypothetical protein